MDTEIGGVDFNKVVAKIIEDKGAEIGKSLKDAVVDQWKKIKTDSTLAFSKYLKNASEKYAYVKTLLYRTTPKYLYEFFECCDLKLEDRRVDANDLENVLNEAGSNFLIIQGTGGIGKSTLLKHFFLNAIKRKELIPIFVELKDLNNFQEDLFSCIYNSIVRLGFNLEAEYLSYAMKWGMFVILLDGFDELSLERRITFQTELDSLCDKYPDNCYIISSRPNKEDFISFQRFTVLDACCLTKDQALSLINKLEYDESVKTRFMQALDTKLFDKHNSFASNPLLLTIMLLTFDNYADIPDKLHIFYSNAFETLYTKHDATKAGFRREMKSGLSFEDFRKVFARFCFVTYVKNEIVFSPEELHAILDEINQRIVEFNVQAYIEDLQDAVCVLFRDGLEYRFTHRSFQEYFVAVYLKEMTDANLSKAVCSLIEQQKDKLLDDNTVNMLYDMAPERVENQVIIPILEKVEQARPQTADAYDYYLDYIVESIRVWKPRQLYGDESWELGISLTQNGYSEFIFEMVIKGIVWPEDNFDYGALAQKIQLKEMNEEKKDKNGIVKAGKKAIFTDEEIYAQIKETWLGYLINKLCGWLSELYEKRESSERDISDILDL